MCVKCDGGSSCFMCKLCQPANKGGTLAGGSCGSSDVISLGSESPCSPRSAGSDASDAGFVEDDAEPPPRRASAPARRCRRRRHSDGGPAALLPRPAQRRRACSGERLARKWRVDLTETPRATERFAGFLSSDVKQSTQALLAVKRRLQLELLPEKLEALPEKSESEAPAASPIPNLCHGVGPTHTANAIPSAWSRDASTDRLSEDDSTRLDSKRPRLDGASLCRAPSETSSVDSGLGTPSEPAEPAEPAVVRFPARRAPAAGSARPCCRWRDCGERLSSATQLLDHLQSRHVQAQRGGAGSGRSVRCLWQGCKVFDRPGSAAWLERHVLAHGGSRPFRCIVDGCSQRFSSQSVLERHVNSHFSSAAAPRRPDGPAKLARRSSRRAIQEQHPYSARIFDFCDAEVMERLRYQLVRADEELDSVAPVAGRQLQLTAQVIARRTCADNKPELLVRWSPPNIAEDQWVPAQAFRPTRLVPFSRLPTSAATRLSVAVGAPPTHHRRKRRPP